MAKKLIYPFFICFVFIHCGPKHISFSESEVESFSQNSQLIKNNIELFLGKNKDYFKVSTKSNLDSIIGKNDFNFLEKIDFNPNYFPVLLLILPKPFYTNLYMLI